MCLICVAWRSHPRYRLVVAANRDELHARPAAPAHWWDDAPGVLAGRDLVAGGTWLGVAGGGRFAALTNFHDPAAVRADAPSRGALVGAFLTAGETAPDGLARIVADGRRYNGFSLLATDGETLAFASNRVRGVRRLAPGVYGLSNHLLDTPWPKVTGGKADLARLLAAPDVAAPDLLALLAERPPAGEESPCAYKESALGLSQSRASRFILDRIHGTRTSTVVLLDAVGAGVFVERTFDADGRAVGDAVLEVGPARAG